jgi:phosphoserine phosphatase
MDSTVIAMECIDEIAAIAGVKDKVSAVTERAMMGEIAFAESLHERVACLAGIHQTDLYAIRDRLPFMPGFVKTTQILQGLHWKLAIASGGFTFFADYIKESLKLDYALSNRLEVIGDTLSGKVLGSVIDAQAKANALTKLQKECGLEQSQTVAIGDGANDLLMMEAAGNSVAFRAKPAVSKAADTSIIHCGFEALLYAMPHKF